MAVIAATSSCNAFPAVSKGVEIRICQDRDCLTDGALKANEIVESLCKKSSGNTPVTVTKVRIFFTKPSFYVIANKKTPFTNFFDNFSSLMQNCSVRMSWAVWQRAERGY